jgi:predicted RNase H-like HicB family nuclease
MIVKIAMKKLKFVVEKHRDGYVAYPLGLKGAVVGQGDSYESALADAKSATAFHIESFGKEAFDDQDFALRESSRSRARGRSEPD